MAGKFQSLWHCYWWRAYELALGSQFLDGGTLSNIWIVEEVTIWLQKEITHFCLSGKCCVNLVSFQTCSFLVCLRSFSFSAILIFSYKAFLTWDQQCELVRKRQHWVVLSFSKKEAVATGMVPASENDQFSTNQGTIFHPWLVVLWKVIELVFDP